MMVRPPVSHPTDRNPDSAIYLDHAATTPALPAVVEAVARAQRDWFGNPSSKHGFGTPARKHLADAREFLRGTLSAAEIVFTSGGSEADMLGIVGAAAVRSPGRVLVAASDHPAALSCTDWLARLRMHVTVLPVTRHGDIAPETLAQELGPDVRVVTLLHGHNELGTLTDLEACVQLVRERAPDCHVHVDLVQAYGKIPFEIDEAGVDSCAVSAHKLHGPRGVGFLALGSTARIAPVQRAGGQEHNLRGGTENLPGIHGLMVAAEQVLSHMGSTGRHTAALAHLVEQAVTGALPGAERLGNPQRRLPHILSLRIPGVNGQALMERCDTRGIAFSVGAACHGAHGDEGGTNHVLAAIGLDRRQAREVIRLSFARETTEAAAQRAATTLVEEALTLRALAPQPASGSAGRG